MLINKYIVKIKYVKFKPLKNNLRGLNYKKYSQF